MSDQRTCGSCTMCCKVLPIKFEEETKPAGQWCGDCRPGKGCSIYADRPEGCRKYRCLWLLGQLPEWFYPARSKIVVDAVDGGNGKAVVRVFVDPGYPNRWREEPYYSALKMLAGEWWGDGIPMKVVGQGEAFLLTGRGSIGWKEAARVFNGPGATSEQVQEILRRAGAGEQS